MRVRPPERDGPNIPSDSSPVHVAPGGQQGSWLMSQILSLSLRIPPVRRFLALVRWPRREHLDGMSADQLHGYIRATGIEADARAALAEYRGGNLQTEAVTGVRKTEDRAGKRRRAVVP